MGRSLGSVCIWPMAGVYTATQLSSSFLVPAYQQKYDLNTHTHATPPYKNGPVKATLVLCFE